MRFGQQRSLSPRPNEHGALRWLSFYDHPFSQPRVILRARVAARQGAGPCAPEHSYFYGGGSNLGNFRNFID